MWRVLLDSGSDGDLLFVQKGLKENVPFKERFRPQKWGTLNGTFRTTKVGNLDMIFPEFSESKIMHLKPDIVDIPEKDTKPAYDLILGTEILAKLGVILDFESNNDIYRSMQIEYGSKHQFYRSEIHQPSIQRTFGTR